MTDLVDFARSDMETMQDILRVDTRAVPWPLLEQSPSTLGTTTVPVDLFLSKEVHDLEVERLWKKIWQWACRLEEIPKVGDHVVYDIADLSVIVVRAAEGAGPGAIKAYRNVCLHRGTQLRVEDGNVPKFRCPFHGWTWNLDGSLDWIPCEWDFPQVDAASHTLPEVLVDSWQGFVFINFDPDAEPLLTFLENVPSHFECFPLEDRYIAINVEKVMPANWKVTMAAFAEAYHTVVTHPGILTSTGDANTQYDVWGLHSRLLTPFGVASPHVGGAAFDQVQVLSDLRMFRRGKTDGPALEPGTRARPQAAADIRTHLGRGLGVDLSDTCDALILDGIQYFVFPNFMPWASLANPLVYRFRPNGDDVDSCIMNLMALLPFSGERPKPAKLSRVPLDKSWSDEPTMGATLGTVYDQDSSNLARVQKGMKAGSNKTITLGEYQESRIRHFHANLERYLADPQ